MRQSLNFVVIRHPVGSIAAFAASASTRAHIIRGITPFDHDYSPHSDWFFWFIDK